MLKRIYEISLQLLLNNVVAKNQRKRKIIDYVDSVSHLDGDGRIVFLNRINQVIIENICDITSYFQNGPTLKIVKEKFEDYLIKLVMSPKNDMDWWKQDIIPQPAPPVQNEFLVTTTLGCIIYIQCPICRNSPILQDAFSLHLHWMKDYLTENTIRQRNLVENMVGKCIEETRIFHFEGQEWFIRTNDNCLIHRQILKDVFISALERSEL